MMRRFLPAVLVVGFLVLPLRAQPREWSDDFTVLATYDSASTYAPCLGGPYPKYTLMEALLGDMYQQQLVSGNGRLMFTNRRPGPSLANYAIDIAVIGYLDVTNCPGGPGFLETSEPFTSGNICTYGGLEWTPWQLRAARNTYGADGKPGIGNVDDDLDGVTDEANEAPSLWPTTVNRGYGNPDGTGFAAGQDAKPGVAGVDDDGNGVVDDLGETGWSGSDDGDDMSHHVPWIYLKGNFDTTDAIYINLDIAWSTSIFCFFEVEGAYVKALEVSDETTYGYYQPYHHYNWTFCVSSHTCYGAVLWHGPDMANPDETLGPMINTGHTLATDNNVGFGYAFNTDANTGHYQRQIRFLGNQNFSDRYWVVSGNPATYYPSPSADLDNDKDVDGFDFLTFSNCYNGSNKPPLAACASTIADLDKDGDVDGFDFLTFSNCYNGSNRKPLAACFPLNVAAYQPPAYDTCATARPISDGSYVGEITSAHSDTISCPVDEGGRDVWFQYTPTCTGTATIQTCDRTGLTKPIDDVEISVYSTCGGSALAGPCFDGDACSGAADRMESITVPVSAGVPIYIAIQGEETQDLGQFVLTVSCSP